MRGSLPETHGTAIFLPVADPGAGAGFDVYAPNGMKLKIITMRFQFVCAVAVANRRVQVDFIHAGNSYGRIFADAVVVAGSTSYFNFFPGFGSRVGSTLGNFFLEYPEHVWVYTNDLLRFTADNIQAADQFSAIMVYAEYWVDDPF